MRLCVRLLRSASLIVFFVVALAFARPALADVAPPQPPPGSNPGPASETTQVQMASEQVIVEVRVKQASQPQLAGDVAEARVTATFNMRNLGAAAEQMQVRFPLNNPNGWGDGFGNFPEIEDLRVTVGGARVTSTRVETPNPSSATEPPIAWAAFDVSFPPGQEVVIGVTYTLQAEGYLPYATFNYVLETGAGWKDSIGTADFILRMPYETNEMNVLTVPDYYPRSTPNGQFSGNEVRWHFENLEPTPDENAIFQASVVLPHLWQAMLAARQNAEANADDGDAWGALGRAYKQMLIEGKGWIRSDKAGREMFALAVEAYERAIALSPKTSKWHSGYAELLLPDYCFGGLNPDPAILVRTAQLLNTALSLDPENEQALQVLDSMAFCAPGAAVKTDSGVIFYVLTETPAPPRPTETLAPSETPTDVPVIGETVNPTAEATMTFAPATESPAAQPTATPAPTGSGRAPSLCASVILVPPAVVGWAVRRKRKGIQDRNALRPGPQTGPPSHRPRLLCRRPRHRQ